MTVDIVFAQKRNTEHERISQSSAAVPSHFDNTGAGTSSSLGAAGFEMFQTCRPPNKTLRTDDSGAPRIRFSVKVIELNVVVNGRGCHFRNNARTG